LLASVVNASWSSRMNAARSSPPRSSSSADNPSDGTGSSLSCANATLVHPFDEPRLLEDLHVVVPR
jgi:hypothetical protein